MKAISVLSSIRSSRGYLLGLLVFFGVLTLSACGGVNSVRVYDHARVLNTAQVRHAASSLPNNVDIYTVNNFTGTQADFQRAAVAKLGGNPNRIVMAIDTAHNYVYIARGSNVPLTSASTSQAVSSFASNYHNGDYTRATVAALNSMNGTLGANRGPTFSPIALACLPLLLLGFLFFIMRARRSAAYGYQRGFGAPQGPYQQPSQPGYPYDQSGYGPQGGYGPPMQRGGANPWMAGGLGAAAGGLAGYELGKMQGERRDDAGNFGQDGGDSGAGGNFGPGNGGSESGDYGAGGSFGPGGGFDSGGGGSFGPGGADYGGDEYGGGGNFGGGGFGGGGSFGGGDSGGGGSFGGGDPGGGGDFGSGSGGGGNF